MKMTTGSSCLNQAAHNGTYRERAPVPDEECRLSCGPEDGSTLRRVDKRGSVRPRDLVYWWGVLVSPRVLIAFTTYQGAPGCLALR